MVTTLYFLILYNTLDQLGNNSSFELLYTAVIDLSFVSVCVRCINSSLIKQMYFEQNMPLLNPFVHLRFLLFYTKPFKQSLACGRPGYTINNVITNTFL